MNIVMCKVIKSKCFQRSNISRNILGNNLIYNLFSFSNEALRDDEYETAQEEAELQSGDSNTASQDKTYIAPKETTLEIKRRFSVPGIEYKLVLYSYNMHNEDDFARLTWKIQCANPIVPDDWTLLYEPFLHSASPFNFTLNIAKNKVSGKNTLY